MCADGIQTATEVKSADRPTDRRHRYPRHALSASGARCDATVCAESTPISACPSVLPQALSKSLRSAQADQPATFAKSKPAPWAHPAGSEMRLSNGVGCGVAPRLRSGATRSRGRPDSARALYAAPSRSILCNTTADSGLSVVRRQQQSNDSADPPTRTSSERLRE